MRSPVDSSTSQPAGQEARAGEAAARRRRAASGITGLALSTVMRRRGDKTGRLEG